MTRLKAPQRREQLMQVATRLFAERGYDATTTAAIAEAAGVTEPILYRHFRSKQELFIAIVRELSTRSLLRWQELIAGIESPADQVRRIGEGFDELMAEQADAYNVIHGAVATSRDKRVLGVIREYYAQIETFFVGIVKAGQQQGIFRHDLDPRVPAWMMINTGTGYALINLNLAKFEQLPISEVVEFTLRGMIANRGSGES